MLPGGVWREEARHRDFRFKPLTGELELAIAEFGSAGESMPRKVTAILTMALERLGGAEATPDRVGNLCVADRQFLVRQLAHHLGNDGIWLSAPCGNCESTFDFHVQQSALPVKAAGAGFPFTTVETGLGVCRARVPCGLDQEAISRIDDVLEAKRALSRRCILAVDGRTPPGPWEQTLAEEDIDLLEQALEAVAPEVALAAAVSCPECQTDHAVAVDPYLCLYLNATSILSEIHTLASAYHWSQAEILGLPQARRHLFLKYIDRSRGMAG